ncbi:MAG TPA: radical SAM protein [Deltaproteobacteria bacterium]|nr:radical SAM protein [Deltaproteobacteria bacterium]
MTNFQTSPKKFHGRGTSDNPQNRFEKLSWEDDPETVDSDAPGPATEFFRDVSRSLIVTNDSPDIPFEASLNPYRGCEHGCIYCYARPYHEYLGFSSGLDFESKIMVKLEAPALLRKELSSPRWKPKVLAMSGVTDCYQPIERKLKITRGCLEVLAEFRNPVGIITKNHLVTRDIDLLRELARHDAVVVNISVTTLDTELARILEPRAASPKHRLEAIEKLAQAGIPVRVMAAPVIPALNDSELPAILAAAARAGAQDAGYTLLRLPHAVKDLFAAWLERHFPDRKQKILHRLEALRGGKLNDPRFGSRMRGEGAFAEQIEQLFLMGCKRAGFRGRERPLSTAAFRRPESGAVQLKLFG